MNNIYKHPQIHRTCLVRAIDKSEVIYGTDSLNKAESMETHINNSYYHYLWKKEHKK